MTVRLRAHHLLCMLTYVGRGYSTAFTENYDRIAERISSGEAITIVAGPDDVCAPIAGSPDCHCHLRRIELRDRTARRALRALAIDAAPGAHLLATRDTIDRLRAAFSAGTIRSACRACPWHALCSSVADGGFLAARVRPIGG